MAEVRPRRPSKGPCPANDPTMWTLLAAPRAASAARSTSAGDLFSRPLVVAAVALAGGPVAVVAPAIGWQAVAPLVGGAVAVVAPLAWRWVATSHSRIVLSTLALARVLPLGLNAPEATGPVWPVRGLPI